MTTRTCFDERVADRGPEGAQENVLREIGLTVASVVAVLATAHVVFRPPSLEGRTVTQAIEASSSTALGRLALNPPSRQSGSSGVMPLLDGPDAFAARVALTRAAEVALDVTYSIRPREIESAAWRKRGCPEV